MRFSIAGVLLASLALVAAAPVENVERDLAERAPPTAQGGCARGCAWKRDEGEVEARAVEVEERSVELEERQDLQPANGRGQRFWKREDDLEERGAPVAQGGCSRGCYWKRLFGLIESESTSALAKRDDPPPGGPVAQGCRRGCFWKRLFGLIEADSADLAKRQGLTADNGRGQRFWKRQGPVAQGGCSRGCYWKRLFGLIESESTSALAKRDDPPAGGPVAQGGGCRKGCYWKRLFGLI